MAYPICGAKAKGTGEPCRRPAGWGTDHPGEGRCKLHGGVSSGRPVVHGRYSVKHRAKLAEKYQAFLGDPHPGDLVNELAMMRALFQDYLSRFEDGVPLGADDIGRLYSMLDTIGKLVERINRILTNTALTTAEIQYLQARIVDLIGRYIDDRQQREAFIRELRAAIETDRSVVGASRSASFAERGGDRRAQVDRATVGSGGDSLA